MKLKLFLLKMFLTLIFIPIIGVFVKLSTTGHIKLGFLFLFAIIVAYVALEQLYIGVKRKFRR